MTHKDTLFAMHFSCTVEQPCTLFLRIVDMCAACNCRVMSFSFSKTNVEDGYPMLKCCLILSLCSSQKFTEQEGRRCQGESPVVTSMKRLEGLLH